MTLRFSPSRGAGALTLNSLGRGPTGAAATITAGTTTTGAEGTSATASNSGTTGAAIWDFTIPRGPIPAVGFNFSTTTTDSDPGAGNVRFNNATPASVTAIYFDNVDRDGNTVTAWLDSFDDSTSASRGSFVFTPAATPSAKIIFAVTGSVVDGTGYRKVTVSHVAGTTLPSSTAHLGVAFSRTGDSGTGTFPGSSTDNAVVRFDGTGGSTVQNSGVQVDDSANMVPAANDVGALGTTALKWADLFLASGAVINFNNGDVTLTHSADDLALAGGTLSLPNAGLRLADTNASHFLIVVPGSDLTANRILTITTGDAARTLTISGDHTLPGGTSAILAGGQTLTGGFAATPFSAGTKSSGTFTPDQASGNLQYATNGGAHTLAPPSAACSLVIEYTNNASAGAITTSGFTKVTGDTITTTNGNKFFFFITKHQTYSHLSVQALQ